MDCSASVHAYRLPVSPWTNGRPTAYSTAHGLPAAYSTAHGLPTAYGLFTVNGLPTAHALPTSVVMLIVRVWRRFCAAAIDRLVSEEGGHLPRSVADDRIHRTLHRHLRVRRHRPGSTVDIRYSSWHVPLYLARRRRMYIFYLFIYLIRRFKSVTTPPQQNNSSWSYISW